MSKEFLRDRGKALEDSFFARQNEEMIQRLRQEREAEAQKEGLSTASGITSDAVLDSLVAVGVRSETLAAIALVPLVAVAWADGSVEAEERKAVLSAAHEAGVERGQPCYELLEGWLETRPGPEVVAAWKAYVNGLSEHLDEVTRSGLKREVLGRARTVAEAAGGFLGVGRKVSSQEEEVLADLDAAFA